MKKTQKIILIVILIFIILVCIPVFSYFYHLLKFEHVLESNGFMKNEQGTYFNNQSEFYQGIDITEYHIFSYPSFIYTNYILPVSYSIEFHDLNDDSKNKISLPSDYYNLSPGKKSTIDELEASLNQSRDIYYLNGEHVSEEQWKEAAGDYVSRIKENYNNIINMLK